jgi:parallel beta-helix repeat protein
VLKVAELNPKILNRLFKICFLMGLGLLGVGLGAASVFSQMAAGVPLGGYRNLAEITRPGYLAQLPGAPKIKTSTPIPADSVKSPGPAVEVSAAGLAGKDLKQAISLIGNQARTLCLAAGVWKIDANLTIPPNIALKIDRGAILAVSPGVTLSMNGPLADCTYQIFNDHNSSLAKGVKFDPGAVTFVRPEWWGARGDGKKAHAAINSLAIEKALHATRPPGGVVQFALGRYYIKRTIVLPRGAHLVGQGKSRNLGNGTVIILDDQVSGAMVEDSTIGHVLSSGGIRGINFAGGNNHGAVNGIHFHHGSRLWHIRDCLFYGISGWALYIDGVFRCTIEHNNVVGCGNGMYLYMSDGWVLNNEVAPSKATHGIYMVGTNSVVRGNIVFGDAGCTNGLYIHGAAGTSFIGNRIDSCDYGIRINRGGGMIIGNDIVGNKKHGIYSDYAFNHCLVANNYICKNGRSGAGYGIAIEQYCEGGQIVNNIIRGNASGPINFTALPANTKIHDYPLIENNSGVDLQGDFPTLASGSTPAVVLGKKWQTSNATRQILRDFAKGCQGKEILVIFGDSHTTLKFSGDTRLKGHGGVDWQPRAGDHLRAVKMGQNWYCECFKNKSQVLDKK